MASLSIFHLRVIFYCIGTFFIGQNKNKKDFFEICLLKSISSLVSVSLVRLFTKRSGFLAYFFPRIFLPDRNKNRNFAKSNANEGLG